jgi:hypothetical protein
MILCCNFEKANHLIKEVIFTSSLGLPFGSQIFLPKKISCPFLIELPIRSAETISPALAFSA